MRKMMVIVRIVVFVSVCLLFFTCATTPPNAVSQLKSLKKKNMAVLSPLFMSDIYSLDKKMNKFDKNMFVGAIYFRRGYYENPRKDMMIQSKVIELREIDWFKKNASGFLGETLTAAIKKRGIAYTVYNSEKIKLPPPQLLSLRRRVDRTSYDGDGRDNINLPRYVYTPQAMPPDTRTVLRKKISETYLAIPVVHYYYGHAAGWFNDQKIGCPAGGRMSFHVYIYNLETGKPFYVFQEYERWILSGQYRISVPRMKALLFKLQKRMEKRLVQAFR